MRGKVKKYKTYIFDIDNTIANNEKRIHFLHQEPKDWKSWHERCTEDTPYWEIVDLIDMAMEADIRIVLCTGRDSFCRKDTEEWLLEHGIYYDKLYMRAEGDRRSDADVKRELLAEMRSEGFDPVLVFEDRDRVVQMWRDEGLRCLQVAPGNF